MKVSPIRIGETRNRFLSFQPSWDASAFQATPKPGYVFARWDGADDALTGAQRISPRMTVTVDRPLTLTAVYSVALSARAYVQDGLIAQWDAIENAGYGQHDGAPTVWKDLSRSGYDIALPASGVVVSDKTLQLSQTNMVRTIPELSPHGIFHGEAYAAADRDYVSSDNRREVFYNYQIALFFRNEKTGLVCGAYDTSNDKSTYWYAPGKPTLADAQAFHTYSIFSSTGVGSSYSCDGALPTDITSSFISAWAVNVYGINGDLHFGSPEVTLNYGGVRLYKRKLTDAEVAWNAMIDRVRFAGESLDPEVTLETIRVVDGVVQYGCKAAADASGFGSVEITVDGEAGTVGEYNWFEAGKKTKVVFTAKPASGKAFVRWAGETTLGNDKLYSSTFEVEDMPLSLTAVFRETAAKTWVGTSESANVAENWSPVGVPETGDAIVLNGDCNQPMTWDIKDVKPGSWVQDGYTGTVTIPVGTPGIVFWKYDCPVYGCEYDGNITRFEVIGDVVIKSGAWKSAAHPANNSPNPATACSGGMGAYRLYVKVGGTFSLSEGGVRQCRQLRLLLLPGAGRIERRIDLRRLRTKRINGADDLWFRVPSGACRFRRRQYGWPFRRCGAGIRRFEVLHGKQRPGVWRFARYGLLRNGGQEIRGRPRHSGLWKAVLDMGYK